VLNQPEPSSTPDFGDTVMANSLEVYEVNINLEEVQCAVSTLMNNKPPGVNEISAEMLKHGKKTVVEQLAELFNMVWQDLEVPEDWKKGVINKLPKKEVSRTAIIGEESHYFLHPAKSSAQCS